MNTANSEKVLSILEQSCRGPSISITAWELRAKKKSVIQALDCNADQCIATFENLVQSYFTKMHNWLNYWNPLVRGESEWNMFQIPVCVRHELLLTNVWKHCNKAKQKVIAQLLDCNVCKMWLTCSSLDGSTISYVAIWKFLWAKSEKFFLLVLFFYDYWLDHWRY